MAAHSETNTETVRLSHFWYDGPVLAVEVMQSGTWLPYADTPFADDIDAALGSMDADDWPEGIYVLNVAACSLTAAP